MGRLGAAHRCDLVDDTGGAGGAHGVEQIVRLTEVVGGALKDRAHHRCGSQGGARLSGARASVGGSRRGRGHQECGL